MFVATGKEQMNESRKRERSEMQITIGWEYEVITKNQSLIPAGGKDFLVDGRLSVTD